jgi:hypothetical protein
MARISALFKAGTLDVEWAQIWDFTGVENVDGVSTGGIDASRKAIPGRAPPSAPAS